MGLNGTIALMSEWLIPSAISSIACFTIIYLYYKAVYRLLLKREGKMALHSAVSASVLFGYAFLVFALTCLCRSEIQKGWINADLFSAYVESWYNWSGNSFLMLVINLVMLIPFGFLLPFVHKALRSLKAVLICSFFFTAFIEIFQYVTHRGIFELDDLIHNTVGAIFGCFFAQALIEYKETKTIRVRTVIKAAVIPAFFICIFGSAFIIYHAKEFGNISYRKKVDMSQIELVCEIPLPEEPTSVPVYYNVNANQPKKAESVAQAVQSAFDLPKKLSAENISDTRQFKLENSSKKYLLTYFTREGTWWVHNYSGTGNSPYSEEIKTDAELALKKVLLLNKSDALEYENGMLTYKAEGDFASRDDFMVGSVALSISESGELTFLRYGLIPVKYVREIEIITVAEAYETVLKGDFYGNQPFDKYDKIRITGVEVTHLADSKGYYQPAYRFTGLLNDETSYVSFTVPALP